IGHLGVFSFNGNKIITTGGGGMIVTHDEKIARKARYLTTQAKNDHIRFIHHEIGYNYRLTNLQAALGLAQLEEIEKFIRTKKRNYLLYKKELDKIPGLKIADVQDNIRPNFWFYPLLVEKSEFGLDREELMQRLQKRNILTRPLWYLNHWQRPYRKNQSYHIEKAVWFWKRILNIPCSSNLKEQHVRYVIKNILKARG
ncbi:MAG: DegT/DnrJ/EryC1/StrS family aminotransferase, partial [bacterium]|nr:DegT/DnrJ/EryC1/StrS family aminotransferase [bacterium]